MIRKYKPYKKQPEKMAKLQFIIENAGLNSIKSYPKHKTKTFKDFSSPLKKILKTFPLSNIKRTPKNNPKMIKINL